MNHFLSTSCFLRVPRSFARQPTTTTVYTLCLFSNAHGWRLSMSLVHKLG